MQQTIEPNTLCILYTTTKLTEPMDQQTEQVLQKLLSGTA
jgi:hypothetical protein